MLSAKNIVKITRVELDRKPRPVLPFDSNCRFCRKLWRKWPIARSVKWNPLASRFRSRLQRGFCRLQFIVGSLSVAADRLLHTEYRVTVIVFLKRPLKHVGSSNPVTKTCIKKWLMFLAETELQTEIKRDEEHDWCFCSICLEISRF